MTASPAASVLSTFDDEIFTAEASQPIPGLSAPMTPLQRFALRIEEWLERVEAEAGVDPCPTST